MVGLAHLERDGRLSGHLDGFGSDLEGKPLFPVEVAVAIYGFAVQIDVVVHKHGDAPCMVTGVANDGERQATNVVAVVFQFRGNHVRFVPDRRRGIGDVGVVAEEHFTGGRAVAAEHPRIGPDPLGHRAQGVEVVHAVGEARDVAGRFAQWIALESVFVPVHVRDEGRVKVARHPIQDGLGFQMDGK